MRPPWWSRVLARSPIRGNNWAQESNVRFPIDYLADFQAGLRDLPHSMQDVLWRAVISPQKGHILCDRGSRTCGISTDKSFVSSSAMNANRLPSR